MHFFTAHFQTQFLRYFFLTPSSLSVFPLDSQRCSASCVRIDSIRRHCIEERSTLRDNLTPRFITDRWIDEHCIAFESLRFDGGDRKGIDEIVKLRSKLKRKLNVKDVRIPVTFFYSIIRFYHYIWNQCLIDRSVPLSVHCSSSSSLFHCSSSINVTLSYFFVVSIKIFDSASFPIHRCHCASPYCLPFDR